MIVILPKSDLIDRETVEQIPNTYLCLCPSRERWLGREVIIINTKFLEISCDSGRKMVEKAIVSRGEGLASGLRLLIAGTTICVLAAALLLVPHTTRTVEVCTTTTS